LSEAFQSIHFNTSRTPKVVRFFLKSRNDPLNCLSALQHRTHHTHHFNGHFRCEPGLAGCTLSIWQDVLPVT